MGGGATGESPVSPAANGNGASKRITDEDLYKLCKRRVPLASRAITGTDEPEDLVHDVWIKAKLALDSFDPEIAKLETWLDRIAFNHARDQLARRSRFEPTDPAMVTSLLERTAPLPTIEDPTDARLLRIVHQLPPAQRQVFVLRHLLGFSVPQVADRLRRSTAQVSVLDYRAKQFLKQRLEALGIRRAATGRDEGRRNGGSERNAMRALPRFSPVICARRAFAFA